ncbi:MAG TPA: sigma-54 dependent transcriptional regulator [Gemmatimonadales bacterium]|nr:sigma-54 dependent transcriptional regulator [Gemmatimonadales bacterium]
MSGERVLVVDDEAGVREAIRQILEYEGLVVKTAGSGGEAITLHPEFKPQVIFLDVKMAGLDGLDTLARLKALTPPAQVVMISGHGSIQTALEAVRRGAFDFLEKPLDSDRLLVTLRNALATAALRVENARLRGASDAAYGMVGKSPGLKAVQELVAKVGPTPARVLITGENGTGKELVARAVHAASPRRDAPFIEVNCAAIPSELIESELFGHVKGSFTGAVADRAGKFEQADGGTLFLDEIGDMALDAQAKVLRALQEGIVTRIGGSKAIQVDVRVLAATNKRLDEEIAAGRFREDLYYRLNVVPVAVPPLRERKEDIPALVAHFVAAATASGLPAKQVDGGALEALGRRPWPGNVRELRNAVERLLILANGSVVTAADVARLLPLAGEEVPPEPAAEGGAEPGDGNGSGAGSFEAFREEAERQFLLQKLREHGWNVSETARAIAMPRSNLYKKIERYGLTREQ